MRLASAILILFGTMGGAYPQSVTIGSNVSVTSNSATFNQNSQLNYAAVITDADQSSLQFNQTGKTNVAVAVQIMNPSAAYAPIYSSGIDQRGQNNAADTLQMGGVNMATTAQAAQPGGFPSEYTSQTVYVGEQTSQGYLSYFNSGGVSLVILTEPGATRISSFGRTH